MCLWLVLVAPGADGSVGYQGPLQLALSVVLGDVWLGAGGLFLWKVP